MSFVSKPKKLIKSTTEWMIGSGSSKMPFSNQTIYIACQLEGVGNRFLRQRESEARFLIFGTCGMEFMPEAGSVFSGYQTGSGGATVRCSHIALSEAHSVFGYSVYMRCGDLIISLALKFSIA